MSEQPRIEEVTINQSTSEAKTNFPRELAEKYTDSQIKTFLSS